MVRIFMCVITTYFRLILHHPFTAFFCYLSCLRALKKLSANALKIPVMNGFSR